MPRAAMPGEADLEILIRSLNLFDTDALSDVLELLDLETFAAAAVRQWEEETGWIPFLAETTPALDGGVDETRYFDPPGPNTRGQFIGGGTDLRLDCGLVVLEDVDIGWSPSTPGTPQFAGTDFRLWPYNADPLDRPWTELRFKVRQWGQPQSIRLVGRFGYSATVPDNAWLAILHYAVILALPEIASNITGGVLEFQEAGVTERYGAGFLSGSGAENDPSTGGAWGREWRRTVNLYKRIVV